MSPLSAPVPNLTPHAAGEFLQSQVSTVVSQTNGRLGPFLPGPNSNGRGAYCGDARELAQALPDHCIDLILTDPPYFRKDLPLYAWLAEEAPRLLSPGGFCLFMCGHLYLPEIYSYFTGQLRYYMTYAVFLKGQRTGVIWTVGPGNVRKAVIQRHKPILAYSNGPAVPRCGTVGLFTGTCQDKRYHVQGQAMAPFRYYLDCFSWPGQVVLDPFCGGGTTPAMAKVTGRRWLAFDLDPEAVTTTQQRLADTTLPDEPLTQPDNARPQHPELDPLALQEALL